MNIEDFVKIVDMALNAREAQNRLAGTEMYFKFVEEQPRYFAEYTLQLIETSAKWANVMAILLNKNCQLQAQQAALTRMNDANFAHEIMQRLLQTVASHTEAEFANVIDCAAEVVSLILQLDGDISVALDFIDQCFKYTGDEKITIYGGKLLASICGSKYVHLVRFEKRILEQLYTGINLKAQRCQKFVFNAMNYMIMNAQYITSAEPGLGLDIQCEFIRVMFGRLQELASNKRAFLEALEPLKELFDQSVHLFDQNMPDVLALTRSMLASGDEELFVMGVQFIEAMANNESSAYYDDEITEELMLLVHDYVFEFVLQLSPEYKQQILSADDCENCDDPEGTLFIIKSTINQLSSNMYENMNTLYQQYVAVLPVTVASAHLSILMVDGFATMEETPVENVLGAVVEQLQRFHDIQDDLIQLRLGKAYYNVLQYHQCDEGLEVLVAPILKFLMNVFQNYTHTLVISQALTTAAAFVETLRAETAFQNNEFFDMIITTFGKAENLTVQRCALKVLEKFMTKTQLPKFADVVQYYTDTFIKLVPMVSPQMSQVDIAYFYQLILTISTGLVTQEADMGHVAPQVIQILMGMLFNEKYEEVHKLVDAVLEAVLTLLPKYCTHIVDYIAPLMQRFFEILATEPYSGEKNNLLGAPSRWMGHIFTQKKQVMAALAQMLRKTGSAMAPYLGQLGSYINQKSTSLDFIPHAGILFALPTAALAGEGRERFDLYLKFTLERCNTYVQHLQNQQGSQQHVCCEEGAMLMMHFKYFLETIRAAEALGPLENAEEVYNFVVVFVATITVSATKSFDCFQRGTNEEERWTKQEKQYIIDQELVNVYRMADVLGECIQTLLQNQAAPIKSYIQKSLLANMKQMISAAMYHAVLKEIIRFSENTEKLTTIISQMFPQTLKAIQSGKKMSPQTYQLLILMSIRAPALPEIVSTTDTLAQRIQDSIEQADAFYFTFNLTQLAYTLVSDELFAPCLQYIIEHPVSVACYYVIDHLFKVLNEQRYPNYLLETKTAILNVFFEQERQLSSFKDIVVSLVAQLTQTEFNAMQPLLSCTAAQKIMYLK